MRRWPLFLIAAPAAVAIWSGWVGLGGMCGFGLVQPLPGIAPEPPSGLNGQGHQAAELFADDLARGEVPGVRRIRKELHVGQPKAQQVRDYLTGLANGHGYASGGGE